MVCTGEAGFWFCFLFEYHYAIIDFKLLDAFEYITVPLIDTQIVPSLAKTSFFSEFLCPFHVTVIVFDSFLLSILFLCILDLE